MWLAWLPLAAMGCKLVTPHRCRDPANCLVDPVPIVSGTASRTEAMATSAQAPAVVWLLVGTYLLSALVDVQRRMLYDRLAGTVVVRGTA